MLNLKEKLDMKIEEGESCICKGIMGVRDRTG
jgi:hypothetical protein